MDSRTKFILDVMIGAVVPVLILDNLSNQLGTTTTYIVAALVPVAWVFIDLFLITKRFNFVTTYTGVFALGGGLLTFWFVDGVQYAIKDTLGYVFTVLVFGLSILLGKPIMYYFTRQALNPTTRKQNKLLKTFFAVPNVYRSLVNGTLIILSVSICSGIANFLLNLSMVTAEFGTVAFNEQVARTNAITRIALTIPAYVALGAAILLIRRGINISLEDVDAEDEEDELELWDWLELYEAQKLAEA
ncbi:MAG: VC0807 family protein [Deinococcota bacterium]